MYEPANSAAIPSYAGVASAYRSEASDAAEPLGLPFFLFCLYTFVLVGRPQDYIPSLVPLRLALLFTVLTCAVTAARSGRSRCSPLTHPVSKRYVLFFVMLCAGIPFSVYRRASFDFVLMRYVVNIAFYLLFLVHVDNLRKYRVVIWVLVCSVFLFSLVGILQGEFHDGRYVTGSQMFDPNDVAFMEVSLIAFAVCVLLGNFGRISKLLGLVTALLGTLLTLYTGSRGGLLGLGTTLLLFLFLRIPGVGRSHKALLVVLLVVAAAVNSDKINVDRYLTLVDVADDYNAYDEYGRVQIWQRGFALFLDDPVFGVGVNNFPEAIGTMRMNEGLPPLWQAPHNSFVQILTETGFTGTLAFLSVIVASWRAFSRLKRDQSHNSSDEIRLIAAVLLVGFGSQLVSASFLSQAYSMPFTVYFSAAAALEGIAVRSNREGSLA